MHHNEPAIVSVTDLPITEAKWVTLKKIQWKDQEGKDRVWEMAERTTRGSSGIDAVDIFPILRSKSKDFPPSTIIVEQFRPPMGAFTVELPAGLIDDGETAEEAAIRELKEETGYETESVIESSPLLASDPGMSSANMKLVTLDVPFDESAGSPKQRLDEGEHVVKRVIALSELQPELRVYEKRGFIVDGRLAHLAAGWAMASKFSSSD
ncbi:hypothetical protein BOTBODRAFT_37837 [Botryobasidium botryosum FD-172 SS1]|uniref:Nudix hydrolase domain-containing protein n=1 Tax=Botryobasidium botryosum (strain FD-172 SS1) TaxID=930990 RepID=A0A067M1G1_BOTB1|nr:hypothetical protein BOTBODRAFT_37837 [Botryobasidium botryosum FD-172 SS1]